MKKRAKLFGFFILLLVGCKRESCFGESGPDVTATRAPVAFQQIDVYDNIDVVLTQDTLEQITVVAPQHLEPDIVTSIENGILTLKNEGRCTGLRSASERATVYVHLKKLSKIVYAGSGNVISTNTLVSDQILFYSEDGAGNVDVTLNTAQTLSYIMDENADFTFHGKSDVCFSYTASRGSIDFSDFTVKKMIIEYGGVRDATINVTGELNSIIYYNGNLYYRGTPQIVKDEVHSTGRLIRVF